MNITKKQWMIIGVVIALIAIWYFFLRKKKAESGFREGGPLPDCHRTYFAGTNTYGPIDNIPCMSFRGFPITG